MFATKTQIQGKKSKNRLILKAGQLLGRQQKIQLRLQIGFGPMLYLVKIFQNTSRRISHKCTELTSFWMLTANFGSKSLENLGMYFKNYNTGKSLFSI